MYTQLRTHLTLLVIFTGLAACSSTPNDGRSALSLEPRPKRPLDGLTFPVNFEENKLENVIDYIRNVTGVNFYVNWTPLQNSAGIERDSPVSLQLKGVPASRVLDMVLEQVNAASGDIEPLAWEYRGDVVVLSTKEDMRFMAYTRLYVVRDLVLAGDAGTNPNLAVRLKELEDRSKSARTVLDGPSRGPVNMPRVKSTCNHVFDLVDLISTEQRMKSKHPRTINVLIALITENVGVPEEWARNGGKPSSIRDAGGALAIRTTPRNHDRISDLLNSLRKLKHAKDDAALNLLPNAER